MLAAYTKLKNAEKVKQFAARHEAINFDYHPVKELDHIFFPLKKKIKIPSAEIVDTKFRFPAKEKLLTVEEALKGKLTEAEINSIPKSQEIVGDIMILEIPEEMQKKEKIIAEAYLKANRQVRTIVRKQEMHTGVYRTRKVKVLAGKNAKETIHHENGIKVKVHLEKTYFSARSGNERLRIARQVKKGETVLVMFSGAAPYPLVIAKNSPAKMVFGIELNPEAHQLALENVALNALEKKIRVLSGDVRKIMPKLKQKFERVVMPLPKTGEQFLDLALEKSKKNSLVHLYAFLGEEDIENYAKKIKEICKKMKHPVKVLRKVKCGQFSPGIFRVCLDLKVIR